MKRKTSPESCPLCGGDCTSGSTTFTADTGDLVLVIRETPATVCAQCGESWLDDAIVERIEAMVSDARRRGAQVEVLTMAA